MAENKTAQQKSRQFLPGYSMSMESEQAVHAYKRAHDEWIRSVRDMDESAREAVGLLHADGASVRVIAEAMDISKSRVSRIVQDIRRSTTSLPFSS